MDDGRSPWAAARPGSHAVLNWPLRLDLPAVAVAVTVSARTPERESLLCELHRLRIAGAASDLRPGAERSTESESDKRPSQAWRLVFQVGHWCRVRVGLELVRIESTPGTLGCARRSAPHVLARCCINLHRHLSRQPTSSRSRSARAVCAGHSASCHTGSATRTLIASES